MNENVEMCEKEVKVKELQNKTVAMMFTCMLASLPCCGSSQSLRVVKYLKYKYLKYIFQILGKYFVFCI